MIMECIGRQVQGWQVNVFAGNLDKCPHGDGQLLGTAFCTELLSSETYASSQ